MADEDRRDAIEAAFAELEQAELPLEEKPNEATPPVEEAKAPEVTEPPAGEPVIKEPEAKKPEATPPTDKEPTEPTVAVDKAPQSWKAPQRAKWNALDPDVRQEIMRRERETTKVLGETAQARQMHTQFNEMVQPFQARIQSLGIPPLQAVHELLKADYLLSTSPKVQRAQYMARLIKDYGVDIVELDNALVGAPASDPVDAKLEAVLQQRLAPFQQYIQNQQQLAQQAELQSTQQITMTIEQMAGDPKYPHFETVRDDMADIIEMSAKRNKYLSLEQAYDRATKLNPEVSSQVAAQQTADARAAAAKAANAKAQKALSASVSVGGAPNGVPLGGPETLDRRATIAAAFDSIGGR